MQPARPRSRFRRIRRWWPVFAGVFAGLFIVAAWPGRSSFTISEQTTRVTGPLDANGHLDFATALNQKLSEGISPDQNANVMLVRALGPTPEGQRLPPDYYKWIGVEEPPAGGDYIVSWDAHFKSTGGSMPDDVIFPIEHNVEGERDRTKDRERVQKWPWKRVSQPGVAEWLKKNEKPLELVAAAVLRKHYFNPIVAEATTPGVPQILNGRIPTAQMCREIGALLLCRAMARIADNDFTGAWQDTQTCQRLGRLVAKGGTLIENLVGNSVVLKTCAAQITLLSHCKPTAYQIRLWEKDLEALPAMPGLAQKCDLGERYMSLEVLVRVATHGVGILDKSSGPVPGTVATDDEFWSRLFTRSIDWDPAFINANGFFDRLAAACRLSDRTLRRDALADLIDEVRAIKIAAQDMNAVTANMVSKRRRGELIGNLIRIAVMPAYEKLQNADDRTEQTLRNLKVAFALARFHVETGAYPGGLDGLTPKYMEVVPADLFGGSPLWYAKSEDGYLLYSVGENEFDDGGRSRDDQPRGDDLTVRIPAKPPE